MGRTLGKRETHTRFWFKNLKGKDLGAAGKFTLKWLLEKYGVKVWTEDMVQWLTSFWFHRHMTNISRKILYQWISNVLDALYFKKGTKFYLFHEEAIFIIKLQKL